jgi:hypothetical protein
MLAEPLSATVQAGIVALCCHHTRHPIYVGCKKKKKHFTNGNNILLFFQAQF